MSSNAIPFPSSESPVDDRHPVLPEEPESRPVLRRSHPDENVHARPRAHSISSPYAECLRGQIALPSFASSSLSKAPTTTLHPRIKTPREHVHARRISNIYHFDSVGRTMMELPRVRPFRPRSISVSSDTDSPVASCLALPPSPNANSGALSLPQSPALPREPITPDCQQMPPGPLEVFWPPMYASEQHTSSSLESYMHTIHPLFLHFQSGILGKGLGLDAFTKERREERLPKSNMIDIGKIQRGEDTRTTVRIS
ncbi:MAG TPA: hypothetical protein VGO47_15145 [Chlamydiales bacterium]|nr:hypothetical protein [Chlamydiales bacterium]